MTATGPFQTFSGNAGAGDMGEVFATMSDDSLYEYRLPFVGAQSQLGLAPLVVVSVSAPRRV